MESGLSGTICIWSILFGVATVVKGAIGIDEEGRKRNIVIFSGIFVILIAIIFNVFWT